MSLNFNSEKKTDQQLVLDQKKMEFAWMWRKAQTNICAITIIILLLIIPILLIGFPAAKETLLNYFDKVFPVITFILGYLLKKN